jgi:hypothetical protein
VGTIVDVTDAEWTTSRTCSTRPPTCVATFVPLRPLVNVEHAFAQLGRWRRLSRCYEQTVASAKAWLEVAAMGYLFARLRVEPT